MNALLEILRREISASEVISFARFMDLALYCPQYGYYEKEKDRVGREGDFYTNVSVGPLFGQLLAFQFADWLENLPSDGVQSPVCKGDVPLHIVEAGAHDGRLAADILDWFRDRRPDLLQRLEYWIIEPSPRRKAWQQATLAEFSAHVNWAAALNQIGFAEGESMPSGMPLVSGIIFSNELLDALPLHRVGWDAKQRQWFEWGVGVESNQFVWKRLPRLAGDCVPTIVGEELSPDLLDVLPDGFTTEVCPAAEDWWRSAASALKEGRLMTIDYGLTGEEFFAPERHQGTLRSYRRHGLSADVLAEPGQKDITAHLNFTAIQRAGEAEGLRTESFVTQEQFLTRIAERMLHDAKSRARWSSAQTRQFQTLTHPEHLGRPFRVLVQTKS